jgi:hypothetical protein
VIVGVKEKSLFFPGMTTSLGHLSQAVRKRTFLQQPSDRAKVQQFELQKNIAIIKLMVMPLRNHARWLCSRFDQRTGHKGVGLRSEDSSLRAIFREKAIGGHWNLLELQRLLDHLRKGDVLVVWKLDRLSRSLRDVLTIMERIQEARAGFRSLTEAIDTTTPAGRMMMQMIGSFAEYERAMLRERTKAGLESARDEGRIGGRRPKLLPQQQAEVVKMVTQGKKTAADAARLFNVHPATISRLLARAGGETAVSKK